MYKKEKTTLRFARCAKNLGASFISIGHRPISDWHSHFFQTKGKPNSFFISDNDWFFLLIFRVFFIRFDFVCYRSDAQRAKEGLIEKGYRVDYANAKRGDNSSEDAGRSKRSEFRSRQNLAENGSEHGYEADSSSAHVDNR